MVCIKSCLLATMLLTSMIISTVAGIFIPIQNRLQLRSDQKQIYNDIVKDRLKIFLIGLIFGIAIAYSLVTNINVDRSNKICIFIITTIIVNSIIYTVFPKRDWILRHLTKDQIDKWLQIYNEMKIKKIVGMSLGIVVYYYLGNSLI